MWRQVRRRGTEETIRSRIHPRFPPTFPHTESRRTRGGTDRFRTKAAKARAVFASSFSRFSPGRPLRTPKRTRDLEVPTASRASPAQNAGHGVGLLRGSGQQQPQPRRGAQTRTRLQAPSVPGWRDALRFSCCLYSPSTYDGTQ